MLAVAQMQKNFGLLINESVNQFATCRGVWPKKTVKQIERALVVFVSCLWKYQIADVLVVDIFTKWNSIHQNRIFGKYFLYSYCIVVEHEALA